ncbi:hypothetical protein JK192_05665 [Gluconobacter cerinus]|uniref:hypothetical protein n=1 Tax=Gluconobacter cerinus TaxID=38307 RepID=UPI001B8D4FD1|nr:hypothetical protein [Gluconobacter cerinus]MBS1030872.1 hypothetical protein [Gluconobacter cerinus]
MDLATLTIYHSVGGTPAVTDFSRGRPLSEFRHRAPYDRIEAEAAGPLTPSCRTLKLFGASLKSVLSFTTGHPAQLRPS